MKIMKGVRSLKENTTTPLAVSELNSLIWPSYEQTFTIDPKTLEELLTLKQNSSTSFKRELDPELFHWNGTTVTFMSLNLLKSFWREPQAIASGKVCLVCRVGWFAAGALLCICMLT